MPDDSGNPAAAAEPWTGRPGAGFGASPAPRPGGLWRQLLAFSGPGFLVAVGYMDPGNWATDLAAASRFGYALLWVVVASGAMAMLLQALSLRLGIATGRDLAQHCRQAYPWPIVLGLWVLGEVAIVACDLAEVIGTAIALNLLFDIPLLAGVILTVLDVLGLLLLQRRGSRRLEAVIISLLALVAGCFAVEIVLSHPALHQLAAGLVPSPTLWRDPDALYIAAGVIGATVMPHNLYLHAALARTRRSELAERSTRRALRFATADSTIALLFATLVNCAILVVAAAAFHANGHTDVAEIQSAYRLLTPILGTPIAATLFGLALLAAGQNSSITATMAGQVVMEGFLEIRLPPWLRRLLTRSLAIIPVAIVVALSGEHGSARLLVLSQVVLSLQLPFALLPLLHFTGSRSLMGRFVNPAWLTVAAVAITAAIIVLNAKLVADYLAAGG